jgi:hypothetical protein
LSAVFIHPVPSLTVVVAVGCPLAGENVGPGSVIGVPVGVYVGSKLAGEVALANTIEAGGHEREAIVAAGIDPAPEPPVCHAESGPCQGLELPHAPTAERGSVGIQPCWRPSE